MKIKRYSIPKLPRSKYATIGNSSAIGGSSTTVVNNYVNNVINRLDSSSTTDALSALQGNILNSIKLSKNLNDVCNGYITFNQGLTSNADIKAGGFNNNGNTGIGAALFKNDNNWNVIGDNLIARHKVNTEEGIITNGNITTKDYADGKGAALIKNGDKWNLTIDNADIRGKLNINTLQVDKIKAVGGKIVCTKASLIIDKIGEDENIYRCYFKNKDADGRVLNNEFETGDLAFCQTFNNSNLKRYWRYVTGIGRDFVDLSKSICESNSSAPEVGDEIVQLGNKNSEGRQGALIIEPLAINIYKGINNFILPTPFITLNPNNTKIDANTINFLGQTLINNNFIVDENGNLTVKGHIIATSGEFTGKITSTEGSIGKFNIDENGLYNDIEKGAAKINISNQDLSTHFLVGGENINNCTSEITSANGTALTLGSTNGTALKIMQGARGSYGAILQNGISCQGLHLNVRIIDDNSGFKSLYENEDDVVIIHTDTNDFNVSLPNIMNQSGKIFYIINQSGYTIKISGNFKNIYGQVIPEKYIKLGKGNSNTVIFDGNNWNVIN